MASLPLPPPPQAAGTGFDHAELGHNPLGHDPVQIYGLPHFAMHFYTVSPTTQLAIVPNDPQWAKSGSYPTTYSASYDPSAKEFRITLGGLTKR